jgi:cell division septum initiation protein DivIVA
MLSPQSLQVTRQLTALRPQVTQVKSQIGQLESELKAMEERMATIGDINQMMAMQLQESMNKQQQLLQMISNMMKAMHDQAKTIINNMR